MRVVRVMWGSCSSPVSSMNCEAMVTAPSGERRSWPRIARNISFERFRSSVYLVMDSATAWSMASLRRIMSAKASASSECSALRHRRNPGMVVWACCGLVLLGVGILGHFDLRTLKLGRGEWETLLCSVFYTGQILWIERREFAGNRPAKVTLTMFAVQAAAFTCMAVAAAPRIGALGVPWQSPSWVGLTLVLSLVCTMGAFSIMMKWQPRITSTEAGLIYCTEPLFASVFVLFLPALFSPWARLDYPNEHATLTLVVGGSLITVANVILQIKSSALAARISGR